MTQVFLYNETGQLCKPACFILIRTRLLTWYDCTHRASVCTSTAVDTSVWIDLVDVTLRDCSYRAFWQT